MGMRVKNCASIAFNENEVSGIFLHVFDSDTRVVATFTMYIVCQVGEFARHKN